MKSTLNLCIKQKELSNIALEFIIYLDGILWLPYYKMIQMHTPGQSFNDYKEGGAFCTPQQEPSFKPAFYTPSSPRYMPQA